MTSMRLPYVRKFATVTAIKMHSGFEKGGGFYRDAIRSGHSLAIASIWESLCLFVVRNPLLTFVGEG